jgi:phosphate starvation-inducible membrane PsiE
MPLRFVVYIAITAVTRHLIGYVNHESKPDTGVLILAGAILILALAVLVIRYASARYGSSAGLRTDIALTDSESEAKRG